MLEPLCHPLQRVTGVADIARSYYRRMYVYIRMYVYMEEPHACHVSLTYLLACMHIYHAFNTLGTHTFLFQIMVAFLSYISNACHYFHSLSGVAERLQHNILTRMTCVSEKLLGIWP